MMRLKNVCECVRHPLCNAINTYHQIRDDEKNRRNSTNWDMTPCDNYSCRYTGRRYGLKNVLVQRNLFLYRHFGGLSSPFSCLVWSLVLPSTPMLIPFPISVIKLDGKYWGTTGDIILVIVDSESNSLSLCLPLCSLLFVLCLQILIQYAIYKYMAEIDPSIFRPRTRHQISDGRQ